MNFGHVFQLRIACSQFILVPRDQAHLAVFDEGDRAIAVPLDLKQPVRVVKRILDRFRQHGMDCGRHRALDGLEPLQARTQRWRGTSRAFSWSAAAFFAAGDCERRAACFSDAYRFFPSLLFPLVLCVLCGCLLCFFFVHPRQRIRQPRGLQFSAASRAAALPLSRACISGDLIHASLAEHRLVNIARRRILRPPDRRAS